MKGKRGKKVIGRVIVDVREDGSKRITPLRFGDGELGHGQTIGPEDGDAEMGTVVAVMAAELLTRHRSEGDLSAGENGEKGRDSQSSSPDRPGRLTDR